MDDYVALPSNKKADERPSVFATQRKRKIRADQGILNKDQDQGAEKGAGRKMPLTYDDWKEASRKLRESLERDRLERRAKRESSPAN